MGSRGGGWVALQMALLAATAGAARSGPRWPRAWRGRRLGLGLALLGAGGALALAGARALGPALTPLPTPRPDAPLREGGPYRRVRHPVYGGLVSGAVGFALLSRPLALAPAAALGPVLVAKARREEELLVAGTPGYAAYRDRVRHRLLPGVW